MIKKLFLIILLFFYSAIIAQTPKEKLFYASEILNRKIADLNQKSFQQETFAELAFLKRTYKLDSFNLKTKDYIAGLNDYYYKNFYCYSKLLNENAIITEDCITELKIPEIKKQLFYTLYPKHVKLPKNFIDQIEEQATVDEFFGPYYALTTIYFLKKYNYSNLSLAQQTKLSSVEKFFANLLYTKYVKDIKIWNFHKFLSLKVLKMNNYEPSNSVDVNLLAEYIINTIYQPLELGSEDLNDMALINRTGYTKALEMEANALLWIFLLELNKN